MNSAPRIAALAGLTLTELTRQKVFYVLLLFALVLIGSSAFLARFTFQQEFQVLKDISLGAMTIFLSLLAIVATARLLPQEIEDRTVYTILAKPVPRWEYVVGKLAGVLVLLLISAAVMTALFSAVLYLRQEAALAETTRQMASLPQEQLADALQSIRDSTFSGSLPAAIAVVTLKACLLASLTLFISSFATSSVFTIVVAVFVYFIGHLQATAREFWLQEQGAGWVSRTFLAVVALLFPDLQQFSFADAIVAGAQIPTGLLLQTLALGGFYIVFYALLAAAVFNNREL